MPSSNALAENRTEWAEDRTILANERTFASWMRTGMGSLAVALGLQAVFRDFEPTWIAKALAEVFVLVALIIFWGAWRRSVLTRKRMEEHDTDGQTRNMMGLISASLAIGAFGTGLVLWWI